MPAVPEPLFEGCVQEQSFARRWRVDHEASAARLSAGCVHLPHGRETKFGSVKTLLDVMIQGRFKLSKKLAHVDNSAYLPHARRTEVEEHVEELQVRASLPGCINSAVFMLCAVGTARTVQGPQRWFDQRQR